VLHFESWDASALIGPFAAVAEPKPRRERNAAADAASGCSTRAEREFARVGFAGARLREIADARRACSPP
jgi:hypothetical protein